LVIEQNKGFSGGANFALSAAFDMFGTNWVYFVTNDCELKTEPHEPQKPGLYAPLIHRRETQKIDSIGGVFNPFSGRLRHIYQIQEAFRFLRINSTPSTFREYFYVPGTAFYIDQNTFKQLGGFDESLHTYWEDVDLSVRAHKMGIHVAIAPDTLLTHKVGKTCHKDPFYTNTLFHRNRSIVSRRHTHLWLRPFQFWQYQKRYKTLRRDKNLTRDIQ
jgi:GT2 family glycosyltransferase